MVDLYSDASYYENRYDIPFFTFKDIKVNSINDSIAQIAFLLCLAKSRSNLLPNPSNHGLIYFFYPEVYQTKLELLPDEYDSEDLTNILLKSKYLKEFILYCKSKKFKKKRTTLVFPIYSETEKNIIMLIFFDLYKNEYFIFSPFFDINLDNVKKPIFSSCQTIHEINVAKILFICDFLRSIRNSSKCFTNHSTGIKTIQSPSAAFSEWQTKYPQIINAITKKNCDEMNISKKSCQFAVWFLFLDNFLKNSQLLYEVNEGNDYSLSIKGLLERPKMFNYEITNENKLNKKSIFGLNDDEFHAHLDVIVGEYLSNRGKINKRLPFNERFDPYNSLKLPVDQSDASFLALINAFDEVIQKSPESTKYLGGSMNEIKESFKKSLKVFDMCILKNILDNNYKPFINDCISKLKESGKEVVSKNNKRQKTNNTLDDNELEVIKQIYAIEGLKMGRDDDSTNHKNTILKPGSDSSTDYDSDDRSYYCFERKPESIPRKSGCLFVSKEADMRRDLIDAIEDSYLKEKETNLINEYCDNIFHNVPKDEKNKV